jgi:hypothetical protein
MAYREININTRILAKLAGWLLIVHGIICILGAFYPFYISVFLFYWFFPVPFMVKLVIVLVGGAAQVVFGVYLAFRERLRPVRWQWLALITIVIVLLLMVYPALNHFFGL